MSNKEQMTITREQHYALIMIKGLKSRAFDMVWSASQKKDGSYLLKGSSEAFDELTEDLADEIEYKLSPAKQLRHLERLYRRLVPESDIA